MAQKVYQTFSINECKTTEASLFHIFWTCPILEKFQWEVFQTLFQILNMTLEPNPVEALFGITGEYDARLTPSNSRTLSFASPLARCAIFAEVEGHSSTHPHSVVKGHYVLFEPQKHFLLCNWL